MSNDYDGRLEMAAVRGERGFRGFALLDFLSS